VQLLATELPRQNDAQQCRIVDSVPDDSVAAFLHLQARLSHFQIGLRYPVPGVRFLQGGADEECQGIRKCGCNERFWPRVSDS